MRPNLAIIFIISPKLLKFVLQAFTVRIGIMPISLLPALLLQIFLVGYTPGPANIYSLTMAIKHGRSGAVMHMWFGLLTGAAIAVCLMAVLSHYIGAVLGDYVVWLKYFGAAYLIYLAYKIWKSDSTGKNAQNDCSFLTGMLIQLTNVKILLFELSIFSTFVLPYSNRLADLFPVAALLLLAGPCANLVWICAGSGLSNFFRHYRHQVDIASAIAIILCAIYIAFS